jgi:archaetidylinositol phosphate synthase
MASSAASHVRINTGVLAAAEKRTLLRLAHGLPSWVNSDHLTGLAMAGMAMAGLAFWAARYWTPSLVLVVAALVVNWFGDSLDGTLARVRGHERPRYGYYVDHVLDIVGTSLLLGGMALSGFMTPVVALSVLAGYLLVSAEVYLATAARGEFRMSFLGVGPTELRVLLAVGALTLFVRPTVRIFGEGPFLLFDVGGVISATSLVFTLATAAVRNTVALYRAEPLPKS